MKSLVIVLVLLAWTVVSPNVVKAQAAVESRQSNPRALTYRFAWEGPDRFLRIIAAYPVPLDVQGRELLPANRLVMALQDHSSLKPGFYAMVTDDQGNLSRFVRPG